MDACLDRHFLFVKRPRSYPTPLSEIVFPFLLTMLTGDSTLQEGERFFLPASRPFPSLMFLQTFNRGSRSTLCDLEFFLPLLGGRPSSDSLIGTPKEVFVAYSNLVFLGYGGKEIKGKEPLLARQIVFSSASSGRRCSWGFVGDVKPVPRLLCLLPSGCDSSRNEPAPRRIPSLRRFRFFAGIAIRVPRTRSRSPAQLHQPPRFFPPY